MHRELVLFFSQTLAIRDCAQARVWSDYYSSFVITRRVLPKFRYCFSLADIKIDGKIRRSYRSGRGKANIKFQTVKHSVMHRHEYTTFHGRESRENEITLESPFLLAPSCGYKNKIVIEPDSRSRKDLRKRLRVWGKRD